MNILPRSNLPPYIEGKPTAKNRKHSLHKPYYTRRVKRATQRHREAWTSWKNSSNATSAAAYLHLQQEQRRSWRILRAERLSYEWKLANSAKLASKKCFTHENRNKRMGTRIQRPLHPDASSATTDQQMTDLLKQTFQGFYRKDKGPTPTFHPRTEILKRIGLF